MQPEAAKWKAIATDLAEQLADLQAQYDQVLAQKNHLLNQMFGRRSEKRDPNQLELLPGLGESDAPADEPTAPPPMEQPVGRRQRRKRKPRIPENLPIDEERVIIPDEVRTHPDLYRRIGEETSYELDMKPPRYFRRRLIRPKYVRLDARALPPIIAPLPPRLIPGGYAGVGLLVDIVLKKYLAHLPLYRQEMILRMAHGIELSRKTMTDWVEQVAEWLKPIYNHIAEDLRRSEYLQVDETPVRYLGGEGKGSRKGHLWVYNQPGGAVLYQWYPSRAAVCLSAMLDDFAGTIQTDGYRAYLSYAKDRPELVVAACWAHARRSFYDARKETTGLANWVLHQIGLLYQVEAALREAQASATLRQRERACTSRMVIKRIHRVLQAKRRAHRPELLITKAINYTLGLWTQLECFLEDGRLEIDTNLVENAIRPTAIGKKNYLFYGAPESGQRSAIIYTIIENCKRLGVPPQEYLHDVLSRLPGMMNHETAELTPANWLAARSSKGQAA